MKTPICDFVKNYISQKNTRLHMPGHKGCGLLGFEEFDITEILGADNLYEADGIIKESEQNASKLFGCNTFYSTEGSSHCIRAMLYLAVQMADGKRPVIAAGRNAHKTFVTAAALLDLDVDWLSDDGGYLCLEITPDYLRNYLESKTEMPIAIYLTSPDYLGNTLDIASLSRVCHDFGVPLLVDNAHGAYLKFLDNSRHPIDLGADMCCDSAHKTLPVLTGGAYLHISHEANDYFAANAKNALAIFGSTSPSYLILQSLDNANKYLSNYPAVLKKFLLGMERLKTDLTNMGYTLLGDEPLKITISTKSYGYFGYEFAALLAEGGIVAEFFDPDFVTLMFSPEVGATGIETLLNTITKISKRPAVLSMPPHVCLPKKAMSVRKAAFSCSETVDVKLALGRVLAVPTVGCPPAVPIVVCGEIVDENALATFEYYGIKKCTVVKK